VTVVSFLASTFLRLAAPCGGVLRGGEWPENASPALGQRLAHEGSRDLSNHLGLAPLLEDGEHLGQQQPGTTSAVVDQLGHGEGA
jgi:hypothetical protein